MNIRNRITSKSFFAIAAVAIAAAGTFGIAVAAKVPSSSMARYACSGNGELRVVDEAETCKTGEQAISSLQTDQASGSGTPQISIIFDGKANIFKGSGFTATYVGIGRYQLDFPPGSFTAFPAPNVTPFTGSNVNAVVTGLVGFGDGSGSIFIVVREPNGTLRDSALMVNITL